MTVVPTPAKSVALSECRVTVTKETSGIGEIVAGDAPYEVYDLSGVKLGDSLEDMKPGFYIVRQGGTARKLKISGGAKRPAGR